MSTKTIQICRRKQGRSQIGCPLCGLKFPTVLKMCEHTEVHDPKKGETSFTEAEEVLMMKGFKTPRTCLEEASQVVRQRRENHGSPRQNFMRIAGMWSQVLGQKITLREVGQMMICLKVARDTHTPNRDNLVDIAGYVDCLDVIEREESIQKETPL